MTRRITIYTLLSPRGASRTGRRELTECSSRGKGKRSYSGRNY